MIVKVSAAFAFVMAAGYLFLAFRSPIAAMLGVAIALVAGFGILRRRVWAAYGFALMSAAGSLAAFLLAGNLNGKTVQAIVTGVVGLPIAALFFFAGRSLSRAGAPRGFAMGWIALACLLNVPFFFVRAFVVSTGSMENTLLIGDHLLARVFPHVRPSRGDLIIFKQPGDAGAVSIKRLVGVAGDRIHIVSRVLFLNGRALAEPYAIHTDRQAEIPVRDNFPVDAAEIAGSPVASAVIGLKEEDMLRNHVEHGEVVVPAGKYFVLGDNRDRSLDSRYWGFIDEADLIGEPFLIYQSDEPPTVAGVSSWPKMRWGRFLRRL